MGKIKKILENELTGGTQSTEVYPVTSIKAVYDENNERLDNIIDRKNNEIQKELEVEVARATNAENNLRETINNITEVNENATSANIVTIETIPNTSSSNVQQALNELYELKANTTEIARLDEADNEIKEELETLTGIDNKDIADTLVWIKKIWLTGTNQPNGAEGSYSTQRKFWYTRIDVSNYDVITCKSFIDGTPFSTNKDILDGINIYGDGTLIKGIRNAAVETVINKSDYSQYSKLELVLQDYSSSDDEFIPTTTPSVIVYKASSVASKEEVKVLEEKVNSNSSKINDLNSLITGINNKDITDTLVWKKARWVTGTNQPNGKEQSYSSVQKFWYTRIDVSNYDVITCNSFVDGTNISTNTDVLDGISIYGDGTLIKGIRNASGETIINRSDYPEYYKLELVLQAESSSDDEFIGAASPSLVVYKAGISQEKPKPKRIVLVGDSLCGNNSALIIKQFNSLAAFTKYELVQRCQGGEMTIGNLTRAGGIGIRVKAEFTIPTSGPVNCALESAWIKSTGVYQTTPYNSISNGQNVQVVINGIRGKLAKSDINAVGVAFYTSSGDFISSLTNSGTFDIPSNATQYSFTINEPATGVPHITINGDAVEDLSSKATRSGYINNTGIFVSSESFKCSELLPISQGEIYIDSLATSTGYVFTRLEEGEETKIGVGNVFFDAALYDDKDYPHIWFTGQNGGYETDEDWANMVSSAANNFSEKYIVCSTALALTTDKLIYQANKCFGARYLNLRAYTQGQAVYDGQKLGIIDVQYSASDYETLFWPGSDKVHQNNILSYIWAVKMWNQLLELGYVEGKRIETGEYYVP